MQACKLQCPNEPEDMAGEEDICGMDGWNIGVVKRNGCGVIAEVFVKNDGEVAWPDNAELRCVCGTGFGVDRLPLWGGVEAGRAGLGWGDWRSGIFLHKWKNDFSPAIHFFPLHLGRTDFGFVHWSAKRSVSQRQSFRAIIVCLIRRKFACA